MPILEFGVLKIAEFKFLYFKSGVQIKTILNKM